MGLKRFRFRRLRCFGMLSEPVAGHANILPKTDHAKEATEDMRIDVNGSPSSENDMALPDDGCKTPLADQSDRCFSHPNVSTLSISVTESSKLVSALSTGALPLTTSAHFETDHRIMELEATPVDKPIFNLPSPSAELPSPEQNKEGKSGEKGEKDPKKTSPPPEEPQPVRTKTPPVPPRSKKRRVAELKCSEVRWFYRRKGVETKWTPFKGCDSLSLEVYWRDRNGVDLDAVTSSHVYTATNHGAVKCPVVLDGMYNVSENIKMINSIYWKEDEMEIRRGSWFLAESMQPINPEMADPIESHYLKVFRSQTIPDTPVFSEKEASKKPVLTELKLQDQYEVRWNSVIDTTLYNNSKTSRLLRYITWGKGTPLKRGYEEASSDDGKRPIKHLIMVVHGIGQKGYENLIAKNSEQVRDAIYACMDKNYPEEESRPMVLPVEWRAQLQLDNGQTDNITLPKMSTMRHALNSTAMDIMYYQSPLYRNEIMAGLAGSLNTVYRLFMDNHPEYDGPISLYAHSLGSVMCYDLLTAWSPLVMFDQYVAEAVNTELSASTDKDSAVLDAFKESRQKLLDVYGGFQKAFQNPNEKLTFKVTNLFCIGSPLAVFLIMRGSPTVCPDPDVLGRVYNVFHPYDPVAYRMEPLVHTNYRLIRPIKLFTSIDLRALKNYDEMTPELHKLCKKEMKAKEKGKDKDKETKEIVSEREIEEDEDMILTMQNLHKSYIKKMKAKEKGKDKESKEIVSEREIEEDEDCDSDESSAIRPNSSCSSPRSLTPPPSENGAVEQRKSWWKFGGSGTAKKEKETPVEVVKEAEEPKLSEVDKIIEQIPTDERLPFRMDFQVQPQITDRSYWSVLKSHFAYWTNADLATFIVSRLYPREEKDSKTTESTESS